MSIITGTHNVTWRFQGMMGSCWLKCIEMLMETKHNTIYGLDQRGAKRTAHTPGVIDAYRKNRGSRIELHAQEYGLATNGSLVTCEETSVWRAALRKGPVIAEGLYGAGKLGWGRHVILIVGISEQGKLAYLNPNIFSYVTSKSTRLSYMSIARCQKLASVPLLNGPFWQLTTDILAAGHIVRRPE